MAPFIRKNSEPDSVENVSKEYEEFAYIVSHDLNAPLRHVREFTRLLIGSQKDNLSEEEQEYVRFLEQSLAKLDDMQQALLVFSRLNTQARPKEKTDMNTLVRDVVSDMWQSFEKYDVDLEVADLPFLSVDRRQATILFTHLLDNALKFHKSDEAKRKVLISAVEQGDVWLFEIKDNGIGIKDEYCASVFRLFTRLEPEKYAGIGAGLTLAQKIVHRHKGEILIQSKSDDGCSVFFSFAKS